MFDTYKTNTSVVDSGTSVWQSDCYNAIISSNYTDFKIKKAIFPWKLLNENIDKLVSGTIKTSFLNAMETCSYYSLKESSWLDNPFLNFINRNPEFPIVEADYRRIKLLIGLLDAFFEIRSNANDESSHDHDICKAISDANISDYKSTVSGFITSTATHLSVLCDDINSTLANLQVSFSKVKTSDIEMDDRTVIFTNFVIYFSLFHYYKDAIKYALDIFESKNMFPYLDDRNYINTVLDDIDFKDYYLFHKEQNNLVKTFLLRAKDDINYQNLSDGTFDMKIIRELFYIVTRDVVTSVKHTNPASASKFIDDYYFKFYSSFYNFCLKKEANFLNDLYVDPEFDKLQKSAKDFKVVIIDVSDSFIELIYNIVMGYITGSTATDFVAWVSNTAEMCITLGKGFSISRSENYSSLTLKSIIHNNAGLAYKMIFYTLLETVIFNLTIGGFSLQELYETIYILLDVLEKYKDKNIVDVVNEYSNVSASVVDDPYYKTLVNTGAGIVCTNPLVFTVNKTLDTDGNTAFSYEYFNYATFPTLPNVSGSERSYLEYISNSVGTSDTIFSTNMYFFGVLNYLKFFTTASDFFLNASVIENAVSSLSEEELCLFDFCYESKANIVGSIIYSYPEKMAYDMLKFKNRFSGFFGNFPLNDSQLREISQVTRNGITELDDTLFSSNSRINELFVQFYAKNSNSSYYALADRIRAVHINDSLENYLTLIPSVLSYVKRYVSSYQKTVGMMAYVVQYLPTTLLLTYNSKWIFDTLTTIKKWLEHMYSSFDEKRVDLYASLSANTNLVAYPYTRNYSLSPKLVELGNKMYGILNLLDGLKDNIGEHLKQMKEDTKADDFLSL